MKNNIAVLYTIKKPEMPSIEGVQWWLVNPNIVEIYCLGGINLCGVIVADDNVKAADVEYAYAKLRFIPGEFNDEPNESVIGQLREKLAAAYVELSGSKNHASDCATSNSPAMTPEKCNCNQPK